MELAYIDTSALAKWYLPESCADEFSLWMQEHENTCISSLTISEFRCLLARRQRMQLLDALDVQRIYATFRQDIENGHLLLYPVENNHILNATLMLESLPEVSLRTLDALHLTIANDIPVQCLVTADKIMAQAAELLHFAVIRFDEC